ncbi:hypothetical protein [Lysobacter sp. GCM10012299]|uniref:hypothetical protein n=1 Tax=Lysobacter sp. GCM10012299 TaxID=3317333 RepID=UPI003617BD4E
MVSNEWYAIIAYRDFHDVPRYVLAANEAGDAFWILDAGFDDTVDEYSSIYTIHGAGSMLDEAMATFESHAVRAISLPALGCVPIAQVQFDETRRDALKLTSQPIK